MFNYYILEKMVKEKENKDKYKNDTKYSIFNFNRYSHKTIII